MGESFGAAAARLSGQAALLVGWSPPLFWDSTPAELACVLHAARPPAGDGIDRMTLNALLEREKHG